MSERWPMVKLGDVLRSVSRPVDVTLDATYREIGIRSHGRGVFHKEPVTGADLGGKHVFWMEPGAFVLNIVFAWEGAVGLLSDAETGMIGSHRFPTFIAEETRLDSRFLLAYFRTPAGLEQLGRVSPGGAGRNRTLSRSAFLQESIPLPPVAEQRRIMARVEGLTAQVKEARSLRQQSAEEADALLAAMAHRADLHPDEKTKAGWILSRLSDVMVFADDSHRVEPSRSYPNLGIYSFGRGLFHKPPISGLETSAGALRRVRAGQFIYSRLFAFEGAYGMVTSEFDGAFVSQEYPTFDCDERRVRVEFLVAYFKPARIWNGVAAGSKGLGNRRQRVQPEHLLSHEFWLPPLAWQERLADVQREIDSLKRLQVETAAEMDALLPSILHQAFNGGL